MARFPDRSTDVNGCLQVGWGCFATKSRSALSIMGWLYSTPMSSFVHRSSFTLKNGPQAVETCYTENVDYRVDQSPLSSKQQTKHPSVEDLIKLNNVEFGFGQRRLYDDLNLTIPRGKVSVIMGPSGCGKISMTS